MRCALTVPFSSATLHRKSGYVAGRCRFGRSFFVSVPFFERHPCVPDVTQLGTVGDVGVCHSSRDALAPFVGEIAVEWLHQLGFGAKYPLDFRVYYLPGGIALGFSFGARGAGVDESFCLRVVSDRAVCVHAGDLGSVPLQVDVGEPSSQVLEEFEKLFGGCAGRFESVLSAPVCPFLYWLVSAFVVVAVCNELPGRSLEVFQGRGLLLVRVMAACIRRRCVYGRWRSTLALDSFEGKFWPVP